MALNAAAVDTRVKAAVTSTMYDMARVNAKGYFDAEDSPEFRREKEGSEYSENCRLQERTV